MKGKHLKRTVAFSIGILCGVLVNLGLPSYEANGAASLSCSFGPLYNGTGGWYRNYNVPYYLDPAFSATEKAELRLILDTSIGASWEYSNTHTNCSNVRFYEDAADPAAIYQIYRIAGTKPGNSSALAHTWTTREFTPFTHTVSAVTEFYLGANTSAGNWWNPSDIDTYKIAFLKVGGHEAGHNMGLDHPTGDYNSGTIMTRIHPTVNGQPNWNDRFNEAPAAPLSCDDYRVNGIGQYRNNCPTGGSYQIPQPPQSCYYQSFTTDTCPQGTYFTGQADGNTYCCYASPILVDIDGDGFELTNNVNGVPFDAYNSGQPLQLSWTQAGSDDAWLCLDRDSNGTIDRGAELFGNATPQPPSDRPNGFAALAEYDRVDSGGNEDGWIDENDAVFAQLRLWQDTNHDGVSQSTELHTISDLGLMRIDLRYKESRRTDEFGNAFRYRAKIYGAAGSSISRWAWDVLLIADDAAPPGNSQATQGVSSNTQIPEHRGTSGLRPQAEAGPAAREVSRGKT